jgi:hypothetical protein
LTVTTDFLIQDNGEADATVPQAEQSALEDLPVEVLIYLLGSRYCEADRLSNTAWSLFGQVRKDWPLVKAICDFVHDRITFSYAMPVRPRRRSTPIRRDGACAATTLT